MQNYVLIKNTSYYDQENLGLHFHATLRKNSLEKLFSCLPVGSRIKLTQVTESQRWNKLLQVQKGAGLRVQNRLGGQVCE